MIIKNRTVLEVEVNGRPFALECAGECTWDDVIQAMILLHGSAVEKANAIKAAAEKQKEEKKED